MRRIYLALIVILYVTSVSAQHNKQVSKAQLENFKKSTTYVVTENNPMIGYDIVVKSAFPKYWKITPFKFITPDEFEKLRKNKNNSFVLLAREKLTKDPEGPDYQYLNFLMGDSVNSVNDMPEILTIPLCYSGSDENSYTYKIGGMLRFAQEHIKVLQAARLLWTYKNLTYYNMNTPEIKKKTLLIESADLAEEVNTAEKIKALYPYDVKIVNSEAIESAIDNKTPNTLILHVVNPGKEDKVGRSYKIIYGVDDNKMYYYNYENISSIYPAGFLAKDFKRLSWK